MARVRGSTHAERPRFCERGPPARTAGRKAVVAASFGRQGEDGDHHEVDPERDTEQGGEYTEPGTGDRTKAPRCVEPGQHGAAQPGLDLGPFDVHRDIPGSRAEAEEAQPSGGHGRVAQTANAEGDQADAQGHQHGAGADDVRGSEPFDHPAAERGAQHRPDGHGQQQQPELAVGQLQAVTKVGYPRPERGEVQPVEDEDRSDGIAGARDADRQLSRLRDGLVCTSGSLGCGCAGQFSGMSVRVCSASSKLSLEPGVLRCRVRLLELLVVPVATGGRFDVVAGGQPDLRLVPGNEVVRSSRSAHAGGNPTRVDRVAGRARPSLGDGQGQGGDPELGVGVRPGCRGQPVQVGAAAAVHRAAQVDQPAGSRDQRGQHVRRDGVDRDRLRQVHRPGVVDDRVEPAVTKLPVRPRTEPGRAGSDPR